MRGLGLAWMLLSAGFLFLAEHGGAGAQAPDTAEALRVAPNAPKSVPEVQSNPGNSGGERANICKELVAYAEKAAADPKKGADSKAKASESGKQPASGEAKPSVDTSQNRSGLSASVPGDDGTSTSSQLSPEQARSLAQANDLRGCQSAAQNMRRAGVALPPGLLALAALREDLLLQESSPPPPPR